MNSVIGIYIAYGFVIYNMHTVQGIESYEKLIVYGVLMGPTHLTECIFSTVCSCKPNKECIG